ncbi:MAG: glycosyltransferase family 2 protein [Gemmatimonadaceae bacterium]
MTSALSAPGKPPQIDSYRLGSPGLRQHVAENASAPDRDRPLVSVVTVVYNGVRTLERTIRSIVEQDYRPIEYIIIDGGSTDGSLDVVARFRDHIAACISEPDEGIYDAMNKGIAAASGEIVGLLNSDDCYAAGAISSIVALAKDNPGADILYGNAILRTPGRPDLLIRPPTPLRASDFWHNPIPHPAMFVTRACYERCGLYRTSLKVLADYDLLMRSYDSGARFASVDALLAVAEAGGFSYKQRLTAAAEYRYVMGQRSARWNVRARLHLNIARSLVVWAAEGSLPLRAVLGAYRHVKDRLGDHEA